MPAILLVLSGADHWTLADGTRHPTGFWAEEFLAPMRVFAEAAIDVTIATPGGVRPTVDQRSLSPDMVGGEDRAAELRRELENYVPRLSAPNRLEDVRSGDYDAVFLPGGHGPMEDLAVCEPLGRLIVAMVDSGRLVSAVCHGPAGFLPARGSDGMWIFAGREMTAFSNEEERQAGLANKAPWLLEDRLRAEGGRVRTGPAWQPFSVVDGNLVTGQNPASSTETAQRAVEELGRSRARA